MAKHKHITEPDKHGYQVRIVRKGKEHSRYFSYKMWGGKAKALQGAKNWRDQMLVILGPKGIQLHEQQPCSHKRSTGVRGVSRSNQYDKRRDKRYLVYEVFWKLDGKTKNRTFHVGPQGEVTADQELHAFRTAVYFRKEYELCVELSSRFDWERYQPWKHQRLYKPKPEPDAPAILQDCA